MAKRTTPKAAALIRNPWNKGRVTDMPHGKAVSVRAIVTEYLKSSKYDKLSLKTKMQYQSVLRMFDLLILGNNKSIYNMHVHKVDYSIVDYLQKVFSHSHSNASIKLYFAVMSNVWQHALRIGKAPSNPWLKNEVRLDNERDVVWTKEQIDLAIKTAKDMGYHVLALYLVLAYETGVRPWVDLRQLTWENVQKHEDGTNILDFVISKTNVHVILPLSNVASAALDAIPRNNQYIFCTIDGRHLTQPAMHRQLFKVKYKAGIPLGLQFRDIRRSVNTELAQAGATREELRSVNGWKSDRHIPRYARIRYGSAKNGMEKRWNNQSSNST